ncbi:MAG TPA: hypothetical protein HPP58_04160, partial [Deltaproteobacteria bacterium]|nr:hypothetical protein [Deltaproteobacteria bacterium]
EVDEKLVRSQYLHEMSGQIYDNLAYYHNIRGIQEICGRKAMKRCLAKYLDFYGRMNFRYRRTPEKKEKKAFLF